MIKIRVPATTANFGPGFDCFGMALKLYDEFEFNETDEEVKLFEYGKLSSIPLEDNLIFKSMVTAFNKYNHKYKGFNINVSKADIPISRGLGSSAACISAGVLAANHYMNGIMSEEEVINTAALIEGHPDNVLPAIKGGFIISLLENESVIYSKIEPPKNIRFVVMTPDFKISTNEARKILPGSLSREDCIFNVSRASMLVAALYSRDYKNIRICLEDKIHQPYRKALIKNVDNIFEASKSYGSLGEFISGSGSTLISIIEQDNNEFIDKMENFLCKLNENWHVKLLEADCTGAAIDIIKK